MKLPYDISYKYVPQWAVICGFGFEIASIVQHKSAHTTFGSFVIGGLVGTAIGIALEIVHLERRRNRKNREAKAQAKALRKIQRVR